MNLLRQMYDEMEAARGRQYQGGVSFIEVCPSKKDDKTAIDSFLQEYFPNSIGQKVSNAEIFANLHETVGSLDIGVLVRYHDSEIHDKDLYFRLNAMNDPALAQLLKERKAPGEAHFHVWGNDFQEAMQRLKLYFEVVDNVCVEPSLKPTEYAEVKEINGVLYTELTVENKHGLHMRPAMQIVDTAQSYKGRFRIYNIDSGAVADAKSIMGVSMLAAPKGTHIKIETRGKEAELALKSLIELFENKFEEE